MKKIDLIAVLPSQLLETFLKEKSITRHEGIPSLSPLVKHGLQKYFAENTGYDNSPIACISNLNGEPPILKKTWKSVRNLLPTKTGSSLWQLSIPEDMGVSIDFNTLMEMSENSLYMTPDDFGYDMLLEDFQSKLTIGYKQGVDTLTFIPSLDLDKCKVALLIEDSWDSRSLNIAGIDFLNFNEISYFGGN